MAKPIPSRHLTGPQLLFPVPQFVSQCEILDVLRLRSQIETLTLELETRENSLLEKLDQHAAVERGPNCCARINTRLELWEDLDFVGGQWRRVKGGEA
jgi:hypothetical protein